MSPREKNLLIFFAAVGFLILNVVVFGWMKSKRLEAFRLRDRAQQKLVVANNIRDTLEQVTEQMDWLAQHEKPPAEKQDVQTELSKLCDNEAKTTSLLIKEQVPLPTDSAEGLHYHRAKIKVTVNGSEEALYRWFDRLNIPEQFRIASSIRISPNTADDSKIDCTAIVEQWFVPTPPSS